MATVPDQDNVLGLSDSEIANMNPADLFGDTAQSNDQDETTDSDDAATGDDDTATAVAEDDSGQGDDDTTTATDTDDDDDSGSEDDADDTDDTGDAESDGDSDDTAEDDESDDDSDSDADSEDAEETDDDSEEFDYKAEYEKLMAPFRANGKEMKVQSAEEVRQLMQMGANYNKKMSALKPNLKLMKMLEKEQLLDESKLAHLVDLSKGNPKAIQKLIKDSGVDPLEFEEGQESDYKPETYTVDDREVELDTVLDEIQDTPSYSQTINVVSNKWDSASRQAIADNPQVLKIINDHMEKGIFDQISEEVERKRTFGSDLNGLSDIEAYKQIGDKIHARGGFKGQSASQTGNDTKPAEKTTVAKKTLSSGKKREDPKLKEKRRAAGSTKSSGGTQKGNSDFNPLALPDEEIAKMVNESLM